MKMISLEEIYERHQRMWYNNLIPYSVNSDAHEYRIEAMREACNQAIELAIMNANIELDEIGCLDQIDNTVIENTKSQII
jgi:hypothetical protein